MGSIKKGDRITADWANALTNAMNGAGHGKTALRGGGGQNVSIAPYQRGNRPLAFDLIKITDDGESTLTGKISGGILLHAYKEEQEGEEGEEKKILLKTEKMEISEYQDSFSAGEKVWVHVTYDADTWEVYVVILEKGPEPPESEEGEAYIVVGEFEERNRSIVYKHKGITCINWDMMKWNVDYKLKTDSKCALELKKAGEENEMTLNIESSSKEEEEDLSADSNLKVWLVQKKGKNAEGEEEGPVKLGVRIKDERPDYTGTAPIKITGRNIALSLDTEVHSTKNGIKYNLELKEEELSIKIEADTDVPPVEYTAKSPIVINNGEIKLDVDVNSKTSNGVVYGLTTDGGRLGMSIDATSLSGSALSAMVPMEISNNQIRLKHITYWRTPEQGGGIKTRLWTYNNLLAVDLDVTSYEAVSRVCDSWTVLACATDYAMRPQRTIDGDLYLQMGEWDRISEQYNPINHL